MADYVVYLMADGYWRTSAYPPRDMTQVAASWPVTKEDAIEIATKGASLSINEDGSLHIEPAQVVLPEPPEFNVNEGQPDPNEPVEPTPDPPVEP